MKRIWCRVGLWGLAVLAVAVLTAGWDTAISGQGDFVTPTDLVQEAALTIELTDGITTELTLDQGDYALLAVTPAYSGDWTFASSGPTADGGDPWITVYSPQGETLDEENIGYMAAAVSLTGGQTWRIAVRVDFSMTDNEPEDGQRFTLTVTHTDRGGVCGDSAFWSIDGDVLTISGSGAMSDFGYYASPWFNYASRIAHAEIAEGITSVGAYAFQGCHVQDVAIPDSVTAIGASAFSGSSLRQVTIPEGVTAIPGGAFSYCVQLTDVTLPGSVAAIAASAFNGSDGVTVHCPAYSAALSYCQAKGLSYAITLFPDTLTLPEGTTQVQAEAFADIGGPVNVGIPAGVTSLPDDVFSGTTVLLILPEGSPLFDWAESHDIAAVCGE